MSATRLLHRTLKFRLYPTPEQDLRMRSWCGAVRAAYNAALQQRQWYRWLPIPAFKPVQETGLTWRLDEFHMAIRRDDGVDIHGQQGTAPLFHVPAGVPHALLPMLLKIYQEGWLRGFHGHRQSSGETVPRLEILP